MAHVGKVFPFAPHRDFWIGDNQLSRPALRYHALSIKMASLPPLAINTAALQSLDCDVEVSEGKMKWVWPGPLFVGTSVWMEVTYWPSQKLLPCRLRLELGDDSGSAYREWAELPGRDSQFLTFPEGVVYELYPGQVVSYFGIPCLVSAVPWAAIEP